MSPGPFQLRHSTTAHQRIKFFLIVSSFAQCSTFRFLMIGRDYELSADDPERLEDVICTCSPSATLNMACSSPSTMTYGLRKCY